MGKKKKKQLTIASLLEAPPIGKKIKIHGWIRSRRDSKGLSFVVLNDGSSMANLQIVATEADTADYAELLPELTTGCKLGQEFSVVGGIGLGRHDLQIGHRRSIVENDEAQSFGVPTAPNPAVDLDLLTDWWCLKKRGDG